MAEALLSFKSDPQKSKVVDIAILRVFSMGLDGAKNVRLNPGDIEDTVSFVNGYMCGDILWVKEQYQQLPSCGGIIYRANLPYQRHEDCLDDRLNGLYSEPYCSSHSEPCIGLQGMLYNSSHGKHGKHGNDSHNKSMCESKHDSKHDFSANSDINIDYDTDTDWLPAIDMPESASRISLEIISTKLVDFKRLQNRDNVILAGCIKTPKADEAVLTLYNEVSKSKGNINRNHKVMSYRVKLLR